MERRTFLKIIGLASACALLPLRLVEALSPDEYFVREVIEYDPIMESFYARYDVTNGSNRMHTALLIDDCDDVEKYRPLALKALRKQIDLKGWKLDELKPLPIPEHVKGRHVSL